MSQQHRHLSALDPAAASLALYNIRLTHCNCPTGKVTRFRKNVCYILQAIVAQTRPECESVTYATNSVVLRIHNHELLADSLEINFSADEITSTDSFMLRLLSAPMSGNESFIIRSIGETSVPILASSRATNQQRARLTQVDSSSSMYSFTGKRVQIANVLIGRSANSAPTNTTGSFDNSEIRIALQKMEKHQYETSFKLCTFSVWDHIHTRPHGLMSTIYQYTAPEYDGIPLSAVGWYLASRINEVIPLSCIERLQDFCEHITNDTERDEWGVQSLMVTIWANLCKYSSDQREDSSKSCEQYQTTNSVFRALSDTGKTACTPASDCEDAAFSAVMFANAVSSKCRGPINKMEFSLVNCACSNQSAEGVNNQGGGMNLESRVLHENWDESACHTTVVAIDSMVIDDMMDRSAMCYVCPSLPDRCPFIEELNHRTMRNLMATCHDEHTSVTKQAYVSCFTRLLQKSGIPPLQSNEIANAKFATVTNADTLDLKRMSAYVQMTQHEAVARQSDIPRKCVDTTLIEGTALIAYRETCTETGSYTMDIECSQAGCTATSMNMLTHGEFYRAAAAIQIRGDMYMCEDANTGTLGVDFFSLLERPCDIILRPMHRVLNAEERLYCRRKLIEILPRLPLLHSTRTYDIGKLTYPCKWAMIKDPETSAMHSITGFHQIELCKDVNLNIISQ